MTIDDQNYEREPGIYVTPNEKLPLLRKASLAQSVTTQNADGTHIGILSP